jgi:hypothetical protein
MRACSSAGVRYLDPARRSWVRWAVISRRRHSREAVRELLRSLTFPACCGPVFYRPPVIRRRGHRILFRQTGGYDE